MRWRKAWRDRILPRIVEMNPDLIFMSAGFDAHHRDAINHNFLGNIRVIIRMNINIHEGYQGYSGYSGYSGYYAYMIELEILYVKVYICPGLLGLSGLLALIYIYIPPE